MRKKSWVLAKGWELGLQRAGTQTGVMTCSVRHYWLQPVMSGGSSGSEVLNGVPLMRHVELGMGTMLEEPQASEPGPTWTPSEIWFDCMGQAHYTCESRQDLIMPGLVWSGYKVWQVCFLYEAGPTDWSSSIHSHSRTEQGKMIGFLCLCCLRHRHNGIRRLPPKRQPISKQWAKKSKGQGTRHRQEQVVRRRLLENSSNRPSPLGGRHRGLLRSVQATERKPTTPLASWAPATKSVGAPRSG